jgi:crotonobetainyl-CoA:carnitine CoA-transferase CaiB-like acyl-CoA transferase
MFSISSLCTVLFHRGRWTWMHESGIGMTPAADRRGPLSGLSIIDLGTFIAGPLTAMMLGDLGAEVLKVEPPNGDPLRRLGSTEQRVSPIFVNTNRGKRSVFLDLKREEGRGELLKMLPTADVIITNWRPEVASRLGLVDEQLEAMYPRLIRVYISGYGAHGPLRDAPAFDGVIQARLGLTEANGDDFPPSLSKSYLVDKVTAYTAVQAVLAALVARTADGRGDRIDVSLLDAGAYFDFPDLFSRRTFLEKQPDDPVNRQVTSARPIQAGDGWIVVNPVTGKQVRNACAVIGRPTSADELLSIRDPADLTNKLFKELESVTRDSGTPESWVDKFLAAGVPAGKCLRIDEHLVDGQVRHNNLYTTGEWGSLGPIRRIRYPAVYGRWGQLTSSQPRPDEFEYDTVTSDPRKITQGRDQMDS